MYRQVGFSWSLSLWLAEASSLRPCRLVASSCVPASLGFFLFLQGHQSCWIRVPPPWPHFSLPLKDLVSKWVTLWGSGCWDFGVGVCGARFSPCQEGISDTHAAFSFLFLWERPFLLFPGRGYFSYPNLNSSCLYLVPVMVGQGKLLINQSCLNIENVLPKTVVLLQMDKKKESVLRFEAKQ